MQVPAFDLTRQHKTLAIPLEKAFRAVLADGHFIMGNEVGQFEERIATYLGAKFAYGVANGSDALVLALLALGIQPGDEVIVPSFTFFATAGAVSRVGATPVFVDVALENFAIDPKLLASKITSKTKAIIVVHLFGQAAPLDRIMEIARAKNIAIIEDAAQALGTQFGQVKVGTLGEIGCFSFFPTKNLGCCGDGGLVTTDRPDLAEKLKMLRVHGARQKYYHEMLGFNSRLDTLQAALMLAKMAYLEDWLENRRKLARNYRQGLQDITELQLPVDAGGHTYNQFTIITEARDGLHDFLAKNEIGSTIYYPLALHLQPVFSPLGYRVGDFPVSEQLTHRVLSLPIFPEMTAGEQAYVITKIRQFFGRNAE